MSLIQTMLMFSDTWGDTFPAADPDWDLIIASDILLCKLMIYQILSDLTLFFGGGVCINSLKYKKHHKLSDQKNHHTQLGVLWNVLKGLKGKAEAFVFFEMLC